MRNRMPATKPEANSGHLSITRRGFMTKGAIAGAAATALYVAPQFTTTLAQRAYAQVTGPCIWTARTLDFETYPSGGGSVNTSPGQIIDSEYSDWGIAVSTLSASHKAMIFDSADPSGNDPDLGTPTSAAPHFGPGVGSGGTPGGLGPNLLPLGKVLIISKDNVIADPNDYAGGGEIYFTFSGSNLPAIAYIDVLDQDDGNSTTGSGRAKLWSDALGGTLINTGGVNVYKFDQLGNNSYERINIAPADQVAVKVLEIEFNSSGAVAEIGFTCP